MGNNGRSILYCLLFGLEAPAGGSGWSSSDRRRRASRGLDWILVWLPRPIEASFYMDLVLVGTHPSPISRKTIMSIDRHYGICLARLNSYATLCLSSAPFGVCKAMMNTQKKKKKNQNWKVQYICLQVMGIGYCRNRIVLTVFLPNLDTAKFAY